MQRSHRCDLVGDLRVGTGGRTTKAFTYGTHRVVAPSEFLPRITPLLPRAGVTRLANITGLDRTGIPTVAAVRPAAQTLSVASGKGLTLDAAVVSAAMEAIEVFSAEAATLSEFKCTHRELSSAHPVVPLDDLPLRRHAIAHADLPVRWTFGLDLVDGAETAVPTDLVTLAEPVGPPTPFHQSSNGLASGAVYVEALFAALLEIVERDGLACRRAAEKLAGVRMPRVRLGTLGGMPIVQQVLDLLDAAALQPIIYDCTIDSLIPVYLVRLVDLSTRFVGVFAGTGAHLDPEIALLRALTEAAQSRTVYIAGSRDDFLGREHAQFRAQDSPSVIAALQAQPETVDARDVVSASAATFEQDIRYIVDRLISIGAEHIIAVDLTPSAFRDVISVVRVIVPGVAGPHVDNNVRSARAEGFARRAAA